MYLHNYPGQPEQVLIMSNIQTAQASMRPHTCISSRRCCRLPASAVAALAACSAASAALCSADCISWRSVSWMQATAGGYLYLSLFTVDHMTGHPYCKTERFLEMDNGGCLANTVGAAKQEELRSVILDL